MVRHIVSFSGGKDSTAMLLMMIEKNMPIDEIIFCDTGVEFPQMYEHIRKVEKYIGREITVVKSEQSFEYYLFEHKKKSKKNIELGYGFPRMRINRWCTSRLKEYPFERYIKQEYKGFEVERYIGIAYDEIQRCKKYTYPLVEWHVTEKYALEYCYSKGFYWNGLYEIFNRVSCWCCPLQPLSELKKLYANFPGCWSKLKQWESKAGNNFRCDYSLERLENRFRREVYLEKNQISMFDVV